MKNARHSANTDAIVSDILSNPALAGQKQPGPQVGLDWRHASAGLPIPTEYYADQPYLIKTDDHAWLCTLTTGASHEGSSGQHVVSYRSTDQGRHWSAPVELEPTSGPHASYSVLLKTPSGRIYCFYTYNADRIQNVKADNPPYPDGVCSRVDSLGYYVFKFSDDQGRSWSPQRYTVPIRAFEIDIQNPYQGEIRFFWNVGRPVISGASSYIPFSKAGGFGHGFFTRTEGVVLKSDNILTEPNPEKIQWETLPDGVIGLRAPAGGGPIAEEQNMVLLSDGSLYCVYRTVDGSSAYAMSRDGGHHWSVPQYVCYANGRRIKHPRAANFIWKCSNGNYLYWFHNHNGRDYEDRNPVWMCGGVEIDSSDGKQIAWSQPDVVLYEDDPCVRMSYPDFIEEDGKYYISETNKIMARIHTIPSDFFKSLWMQFEPPVAVEDAVLLEVPNKTGRPGDETRPVAFPDFLGRHPGDANKGRFNLCQGFTIEMMLSLESLQPGQILLDNRMSDGRGICLQTADPGVIEVILHDGRTENRWRCDAGHLLPHTNHHVAVVVDGGPRLILFVVDGVVGDGGEQRQFGFGRFSQDLRGVRTDMPLRIMPKDVGTMHRLVIHRRPLSLSQVIANYRCHLGS